MGRPVLNLLRLARMPIYTQLHLEEALLRATKDNWLIVNDGAFNPAIVIGISGWVSWGGGQGAAHLAARASGRPYSPDGALVLLEQPIHVHAYNTSYESPVPPCIAFENAVGLPRPTRQHRDGHSGPCVACPCRGPRAPRAPPSHPLDPSPCMLPRLPCPRLPTPAPLLATCPLSQASAPHRQPHAPGYHTHTYLLARNCTPPPRLRSAHAVFPRQLITATPSPAPRRPQELLHVPAARASGVQVLRRFTGGGTVVVDSDTLFATIIMQVG